MIRTIQDLVALSEREIAIDPALADEILLRRPGCSQEEIAQIRNSLPGIPESYLSVAALVALPNVSIGFLNLAPGRRQDGSLLNRLTHANSAAWPLWEFVSKKGLYHVADYEGDMICVVRDGRSNAGEVLRLDLSCPPTPELHRTAQSFEQLLCGFGCLREQHITNHFGAEAIDEVLILLQREFEFDEEQMEDWAWFTEVALGDESPGQPADDEAAVRTSQIRKASIAQDDADVVAEYLRPAPDDYDPYQAIPRWPGWQLDVWEDRKHGGIPIRGFWTNFEERIYKLVQRSEFVPLGESIHTERHRPQISLQVVKGRPKPGFFDWTLFELAFYDLPGIAVGVEARDEIASYRRRLPELLAQLPEKQKAKISKSQPRTKS